LSLRPFAISPFSKSAPCRALSRGERNRRYPSQPPSCFFQRNPVPPLLCQQQHLIKQFRGIAVVPPPPFPSRLPGRPSPCSPGPLPLFPIVKPFFTKDDCLLLFPSTESIRRRKKVFFLCSTLRQASASPLPLRFDHHRFSGPLLPGRGQVSLSQSLRREGFFFPP